MVVKPPEDIRLASLMLHPELASLIPRLVEAFALIGVSTVVIPTNSAPSEIVKETTYRYVTHLLVPDLGSGTLESLKRLLDDGNTHLRPLYDVDATPHTVQLVILRPRDRRWRTKFRRLLSRKSPESSNYLKDYLVIEYDPELRDFSKDLLRPLLNLH